MVDLDEHVSLVKEAFDDVETEVSFDEDQIKEQLSELIETYSVPEAEARRSAIRKIADDHDIDELGSGGGGGSSTTKEVADIDRDGQWITVEVQMVDEWDATHSSIGQTGLVADPTGTIKFTAWDDANKPKLVEGKSYRLENVVTDEYQGRLSIQLQESSEVTELDEEIEAGEQTSEQTGVLVNVNSGSGLIKRCPKENCSRVVDNSRCSEHGEVDGEFDLRIKAVLDDGLKPQQVIFNQEATEELTGVTLDDAKEKAQKQLDTSVVIQDMTPEIINRYYRIEGPTYGEYLMAEEFEQLGEIDYEQVEELIEAI